MDLMNSLVVGLGRRSEDAMCGQGPDAAWLSRRGSPHSMWIVDRRRLGRLLIGKNPKRLGWVCASARAHLLSDECGGVARPIV